jgi:hypothetical protein
MASAGILIAVSLQHFSLPPVCVGLQDPAFPPLPYCMYPCIMVIKACNPVNEAGM